MGLTVQSEKTSTYQSIALPIEDLPQTITYEGGQPMTISVTYQAWALDGLTSYNDIVYTQTITRDGDGNATNVSRFIPQE